MDSEVSPPKRITRARAAKATTSALSATSGTVASAAKSKATNAAPAVRKSTKRKARDDDQDDESELESVAAAKRPPPASRTATRATRGPGRPKKTVDTEPAPAPTPAPRARGRPAKKAATEPTKEDAPVRSTRTRAKKTQADGAEIDQDDDDMEDLAQKPVAKARGRPAGTATSASATTSKPKKTVTFAEPDKENVVPITGARKRAVAASKPAEAPATTGMRAKPVRKPAGAGRSTRTTATKRHTKEAEDKKKASMPLSPKKVSQLSANRDRDADSEDELAMDRAPSRPLHRSPVKPTGATKRPTRAQDEVADDEENNGVLAPVESTTLLGSPVRRPPQSSMFEKSLKSPAKRVDGLQLGLPAFHDATKPRASPLKASLLQSPAKRMPMKPADLDPFSSSREQTVNTAQASASSFKASLLQSPAKRMPIKSVDPDPFTSSHEHTVASPFKQSLLQSPAKRGFSPFMPAMAPEPEDVTDARSPAPTPVLLCSPPAPEETEQATGAEPFGAEEAETDDEGNEGSPSRADFNGRMSTVLPREVDPALDHTSPIEETAQDDDCETVILEEESKKHVEIFADHGNSMDLDDHELQTEDVAIGDVSTTPPNSPPRETLAMFGLREKDLVPFDTTYSESEDEITRVITPKTISPLKQTRGSVNRPRTSELGFTPLARRFDEWQPRSPLKPKTPKTEKSVKVRDDQSEPTECSTKDTFFDDEMCARSEEAANESANEIDPLSAIPEIKDPVVEDISITDEDLDLAAEANEMSVMSPDQVESMLNLDGNDDSISEASQEYGDENEVPGQFVNGVSVPPVTPQRRMRREFHTVSKVPLKPADESTPPPQPSLKKRRHSISRVPVSRPTHQMSRSATVISYSPTHNKQADAAFEEAAVEESFHERSRSLSPPETPSKRQAWSDAETSGRTPRPDVNPKMLYGAVVFVDVHTVEGADASALFVELLTQMGARCVKAWNWNPQAEDASLKIGITHVLFKDGGKRTMEKVRETGGVVHCVGVGWVLE